MSPEAARFIDVRGVVQAALVAVVTYFAVGLASRPQSLTDKVAQHETRIAVMEATVTAMRDDVKAIREAVTRGRR